jgi:hypothetical protein
MEAKSAASQLITRRDPVSLISWLLTLTGVTT